jgi:ribosomal protein S18 acetylase RimI-like enzyme
MAQMTVRPATAQDVDRILQIVNAEPGEEALALLGSPQLALRYDEGLFRMDPIQSEFRRSFVAESDGRVVGILRYQFGDAPHHSRVDVLRLLLKLLGPIRLVRRFPAIWSRTTVDIEIPADALHLLTVVVDDSARGQNVGTQLVEWAESEAERIGAKRISLVTIPTSTRAVQFYERLGFRVTKTVTSASYEKHTGIPGRVYIEKLLPARTS